MLPYDLYRLRESLEELFDPLAGRNGPWEFRFPRIGRIDPQDEVVLCLHTEELNKERRTAAAPPADTIATVEGEALEEVERQIRQGKDSSFRDGFEFTEARLVGSFPRSRIVANAITPARKLPTET